MAWITPTGENLNGWSGAGLAWDDDTGTSSSYDAAGGSWTPYLELTHAALNCDKVQVWVSVEKDNMDIVDIDVFYSLSFHNIYSGAPTLGAFAEYAIGSTQFVTSVRIRCHNSQGAQPRWQYIHEADFNEVVGPVTEQVKLLVEDIVPYATTETAGAWKKVGLLDQNIVPYSVTVETSAVVQVNLLDENIVPYVPIPRVDNQVVVNLLDQSIVPYVVTTKTGVKLSTSLLVQDIIPYAIILNVDNKVITSLITQKIIPYAPIPSGGGVVKVVNLLEQKIIQLTAIVPQYVMDGLLCYWKMDETTGAILYDHEENVNMDLVGNYTLGVNGKINTAVEFEDDAATWAKSGLNPSVLMSLTSFSVEFWLKAYSWEEAYPYISTLLMLGGTPTWSFLVRFGDAAFPPEKLQFVVYNTKLDADANCELNTWYHIVCTWDGDDTDVMKLYINKQLQIEQPTKIGNLSYGVDNWLYFGKESISGGRDFDGVLEEIRFYDRVLTQDEVNQNYHVSEIHFKTSPLTQKIVPGAVNATVSGNLHKVVSLLAQKIFPYGVTPESYDIIRECLFTLINPRPMFKVNTKSRNMFSTEVSAKKFIKIKTDSRKEDI